MRRYSKLAKRFRFWQCLHILCAAFVFSYIVFDVLDLDLSDFPLKHATHEKTAIVTEALKVTELVSIGNSDGFWIARSLLQPASFKDSVRIQHKDLLRSSRFGNFRIFFHPL